MKPFLLEDFGNKTEVREEIVQPSLFFWAKVANKQQVKHMCITNEMSYLDFLAKIKGSNGFSNDSKCQVNVAT